MIQSIKQSLVELKRLDPNFELFGSSRHKYDVNDALSAEQVGRFEGHYRCRLPADYRAFILDIGDGGAGPHYGLFPLGMQDDGYDLMYWDPENPVPGKRLIGDLSAPFKLSGAWNLPKTYWDQMPDFEAAPDVVVEQRWHDEWMAKLERDYYSPQIMNGAMPICTEGCGIRDWLVLNGPFVDTIWRDCRSEDGDIAPLMGNDGKPMSFRAWYFDWLDTSLATLKQAA